MKAHITLYIHTLHSPLHTPQSPFHNLDTTFLTVQSTVFRLHTLHVYTGKNNRGKMYKTVEITCFTEVVYVLDFPVRWLFFCGPNEPQICWAQSFPALALCQLQFRQRNFIASGRILHKQHANRLDFKQYFFDILPPAHKSIALNRSRLRDSWQRWLLGSVLCSLAQLKSDETR